MEDELRLLAFDRQCSRCNFDIEMESFVLLNDNDLIDELVCMSCYKEMENKNKWEHTKT